MHGASRDALAVVRAALGETRAAAGEAATLAATSEGLLALAHLLDRETSLRRTLGDPALDAGAKAALLQGLLGSTLDARALDLAVLAASQRWSSARDLVDVLEELAVTAALLVAEADGTLDAVEAELFEVQRAVARDAALRTVLTERGVDSDRKRALLQDLLGGRVAATTLSLVSAVVVSPRSRTLEASLELLAGLAAAVRSRSLATVTSAVPLGETQRERLAASLAAQLGRPVQLQVEVDPRVVGGVVVRVGDEVIDGSTRHRLAEARRQLV